MLVPNSSQLYIYSRTIQRNKTLLWRESWMRSEMNKSIKHKYTRFITKIKCADKCDKRLQQDTSANASTP